jgi:hypothetical protein
MRRFLTVLGIVAAAGLLVSAAVVAVQATSTGSDADEIEAKNAKTQAEIAKMEQQLVTAHNREDSLNRTKDQVPENVVKFQDFSNRFEAVADHEAVDAVSAYLNGDATALARLDKAISDARFDADKQGEALENAVLK